MDSYGPAGKRLRPDGALNGNGGVAGSKRFKKEMESFPTGIGSKSKPCTKFFSTAGCPFGEGCHFLHYVPGGINAVSQMSNIPNPAHHHPARNQGPPPVPNSGSGPGLKTRMCNKYNSAEGCKYGDKCHFAHGERELGKPAVSGHDDRPYPPPMGGGGRMPPGGGRVEPPPPGLGAAASFGASATAKISVDASLAGAIIGKGGVNSKQICRMTGVKLSIREHESDANLRNIELEGTFDQIKQASAMVRELIVNIGSAAAAAAATGAAPTKNHHQGGGPPPGGHGGAANNFKTKLCENFAKGSCTFGERCHFAHGANELRKAGLV